mgnify:CR=1 FL=1|jgi:hypothetical protein
MILSSGKNKIYCPLLDFDAIDMCLDFLEPKKYFGKNNKNYTQRLDANGQKYLNSCMEEFEGRWEFKFFHSEYPDLYHNNNGNLGFILPLAWQNHAPATIMYKWYSDRKVIYKERGKIYYTDNDELALTITKNSPKIDIIFEWKKDRALIFDCNQLQSTTRNWESGWKEYIIGFVV